MPKRSLLFWTVPLAALVCSLSPHQLQVFKVTPPKSTGIDPSSCAVEPRSKVSLCWSTDESIFPEGKKYAMSATPLFPTERKRSTQAVQKALQIYPTPLLQENLKAVFLVYSLRFRGVTAAGTYGSDRVYLANEGVKKGFSDAFIAEVFHSEFSSVLLWRHKELFDTDAWKTCNTPDFQYGVDGVGAIKDGTASTNPREEWWKKGFINQYATASTEEDFNQLVKYLFSHAPKHRSALAVSSPLQQKAVLVQSFYRKLGMDINAPASASADTIR